MSFSPSKTIIADIRRVLKTDDPFPRGSGWHVLKYHPEFGPFVYVNRQLGLVLKNPIITIGKPVEGITVPTVKVWANWVLQPLCNRTNRREAVKIVARLLLEKNLTRVDFDLHCDNVGWWNDRPWLFDW